MKINSLSQELITELKPEELVTLLDILLSCEIKKRYKESEINQLSVPFPITIKDGGEDGSLSFDLPATDHRLNDSTWIKSINTVFQCKAQKMSPIMCAKEVLKERSRGSKAIKELKPQVKKCLDHDGEYILFTTDSLVPASIETRIEAIRGSLKECGVSKPEAAKIRIFDANQIARWSNEYLSAIIYVQSCRGVVRLAPFFTWSAWDEMFRAEKDYDYQETNILKANTKKLFELFEQHKVVRVVGHKGLGKTRWVLESFNPINASSQLNALSDSVVYLNLANIVPTDLVTFLVNHKQLEGIIVVDNCPSEWHDNFSTLVKTGGNLKLITINDSPFDGQSNCILIDRQSQRETVKLIFQNCIPGLSPTEIDYFVKISEGFPEMVRFIAKAIETNDTKAIIETIPKDFIQKFLFAEEKDSDEYDLFKACSVFTEFPFYDDKIDDDTLTKSEKDKIDKQNELIFTKIKQKPIDKSQFYRFCIKYRDKRSLIERNGTLHSIIPIPIAVNLAVEWWEETQFQLIHDLKQELEENELLIPMMERLGSMDQSERAKSIVSKAWGPTGPFSTAEVLNTEMGSRLFRAVVDVNPEATVNALTIAFADFTIEQLRVGLFEGRRNIVWALERIVFRRETFISAAKMMMLLAAAENENYGNNATGQFMQVFHIQLAGTQANFQKRLEVLEWGIDHSDERVNLIAVRACGHGLISHGFHRTIGAENQGLGQRLKDYEPETWDEIYQYWDSIIQILINAYAGKYLVRNKAKEEIAGAIRSMFSFGRTYQIELAINAISTADSDIWPEAINGLKQAITWEKLKTDELDLANELIARLSPETLADRIKYIVSLPEWDYNPGEDKNKLKAEQLAEEIASQGIRLKPFLPSLLSGEQRQTYNFGVRLGEFAELKGLVDEIVEVLSKIPEQEQNPGLLAGMLSSYPREDQKATIDKLIMHDSLIKHAFYLIRLAEPDKHEILELFKLVDEGRVGIDSFLGLQYGRAMDHLSIADVNEILEKIATYGKHGVWISFLLVFQYTFQDAEKLVGCKNFIRQLLINYDPLIDFEGVRKNDEHKWSMYQLKLLDNTSDTELAAKISEMVVVAAHKQRFPAFDTSFKNVVQIICKQYFNFFWGQVKDVLLENDIAYFKLKTLLGSYNGVHYSTGILFDGDLDAIFNWCIEHKPKAAYRIAFMMPLYKENSWSPFARRMIDQFGEDEKFLDEIAANMGSFGMVGSSEDYYKRIIGMAEELKNHKFLNVRKWAKNCVLHYKKRIRRERLENEERR